MTKEYYLQKLNMTPHPEGGYYKETYRAASRVQSNSGDRSAGTVIYFLLDEMNFSAFHRLTSDEVWYFHDGGSAKIYILHADGSIDIKTIGKDTTIGEEFQIILPANCWFAAEVEDGKNFILVSCSVSPGFEFEDFKLADGSKLADDFPQHAVLIRRLCRS